MLVKSETDLLDYVYDGLEGRADFDPTPPPETELGTPVGIAPVGKAGLTLSTYGGGIFLIEVSTLRTPESDNPPILAGEKSYGVNATESERLADLLVGAAVAIEDGIKETPFVEDSPVGVIAVGVEIEAESGRPIDFSTAPPYEKAKSLLVTLSTGAKYRLLFVPAK